MGIQGVYGGSYAVCNSINKGRRSNSEEVHHMPANSISPLSIGQGPAIIMSREDHMDTASYDNQPGAKAFREKQSMLINQGDFMGAFQMDVEDIQSKFGNKYDKGINAAQTYLETLISEGRV